MKFTWKMIALVSILLALSLSFGGYSVIRSSFRTKLNSEQLDAQEDMRLFSLTIQAVCSEALRDGDETAAMELLGKYLTNKSTSEQRSVHITNEDGTVLYSNMRERFHPGFLAQSGIIEVTIYTLESEKYVLATQKLSIYGSVLYLQRCRNISDIYTKTDRELSSYQVIMLSILLIGVGLTSAFTVYLTRPIRSISRAATQFSRGQYDKRALVQGNDELSKLAGTFNEMADSLEGKMNELAEAAQRQKDFTASFAHELKTPLTSVIGYADTLRSRVLTQEQQVQAASYIISEGKRLEAMSVALLDLFALERDEPKFRSISSEYLLRDTADRCSYMLKEKGLHLELYIEDVRIRVVPELLQTLLYNLIDNARKASEKDGTIYIHGARKGKNYCISVLDKGMGIPQEALKRLTEPFYMVNKSRSRAQGGAGLGLALCQKIAELHHTTLVFHSELNKGTVVSFELGEEMILCESS